MELDHGFYLSIGSNIDDRLRYIQLGLRDLKNLSTEILRVSSVYETPAIGIGNAPNFLNACVYGKTSLDASTFMSQLLKIEKKHGRTRTESNVTSRTLDLDIILFDMCVIDTPEVKIPHPRYKERKFVLIPLMEIDPYLIDPKEMKPISELLRNSQDKSLLKKLEINLFY
jgi:2-amino-4-hydroxy-6-hydroxymethyldihydropteridine diphosphokinase